MKNHWTDKKALSDFMDLVSDKIGKILNVDASKVRQAMEDDLKDNPLDDEEMQMVRNMEINDDIQNILLPLRNDFLHFLGSLASRPDD